MREKRILDNLGKVDDKYIAEAAPGLKKKKRPVWAKWIAVAACLALFSAIGTGLIWQGSHAGSYTANLSDGSEILFVQRESVAPSLDLAMVGVRNLSETEAAAVFGDLAVDAYIGFEETTHEFICLEGTVDGFHIIVMRSDISPDTVIESEDITSDINGVSVVAGYFVTEANSQGIKTAVFFASFIAGNYTVYLKASGTEEESNIVCSALAEEIRKLTETASLDFGQIQ